jgi:hypothetical protein
LLAIPLLGEQRELTLQFYIGMAGIMAVVIIYPYLTRERTRNRAIRN